MKSLERFFITQVSTPTLVSNDGEELVPPSVGTASSLGGQLIWPGSSDPNVKERWEIMNVSSDGVNATLTWRYIVTLVEIDDPEYVAIPNKEPPIIPKQRLFLNFELMTTENTDSSTVNDWLTRRLQGCPFGYLILNEIKRGPDPTVWGHLTSGEDSFEIPKHLRDEEGNEEEGEEGDDD